MIIWVYCGLDVLALFSKGCGAPVTLARAMNRQGAIILR